MSNEYYYGGVEVAKAEATLTFSPPFGLSFLSNLNSMMLF